MNILFLILVNFAGWLQPARAEEPRMLWGKTVGAWIAVYRDKSSTEDQRRQALVALEYFGPEAEAAVPDLTEALHHFQFWSEAFDALVRIGGPSVPALRDMLNEPDGEMRARAASVLGRIGPPARAAVPSLIRVIRPPFDPQRDPDNHVEEVVEALGRIGPEAKAAVPVLNDLLDQTAGNDFEVVLALERIGEPPVRKLLNMVLREANPDITCELASLGPRAHDAVPALRAALTDQRLQVRIFAAVALAHIDPSAVESIPVLIEALKHPPDLDAGLVTEALARLGTRAKAALPILIGLVRNESDDTLFLSELLEVLVQIDPDGTECAPVLIEALKHKDLEIVDSAAKCLGLLGPRAKDAIPALAKTLTRDFQKQFYNEYDPQVSAARALRRIGPRATSVIPALIGALNYRFKIMGPGRDYYAAKAAAEVLGSFGTDAKAAIPSLIKMIRTREGERVNWPLYRAAILALGQIRPEAKAAVPVLRDLMREYGEKSRYHPEIVIALYQLAPYGKEIAERWLEDMASKPVDREMKHDLEARAMVLGAMGRTSFETDWLTRRYLEELEDIPAYNDQNWIGILDAWFENVGRLGSGARLAITRLNAFRRHSNPWVRMWAAEALERIVKTHPAKAE